MPFANVVLILLIGVVFGAIASVILRGRGSIFIINITLGILGALLGAFFPVLIGQVNLIDVSNMGYLLRGIFGSFILVLLASLFRPVRPRGTF